VDSQNEAAAAAAAASGYFDIIQQHRALGRGHHGGGDWAGGWDLGKLREAMGMHYGFDSPAQCIKYMTGSHDQVRFSGYLSNVGGACWAAAGCRLAGGWYMTGSHD
jgi:hypothetical protein